MSDRVVPLDRGPARGVHRHLDLAARLRRGIALYEMNERLAGLLRVADRPGFTAERQRAGVADLPAHLGIKRRAIQHDAGAFLLLNDLRHGGGGGELLKPDKHRRGIGGEARYADDLLLLRGPCTVALLLHQRIKPGGVHRQATLTRHQLRQVQRKAIRVIKLERKRAGQFFFIPQPRGFFAEEVDAAVEGLVERLLLGLDRLPDDVATLFQLGKNTAHRLHQHINELVKKRLLESKRTAVTHCPTQDAAQDVVAIGVARQNAISDREAQRTDVITNDAERHVDLFLLGRIGGRQRGGVLFAA